MVQGGSAHNLGLARVHIEDASGGDRRSWPGRVVGLGAGIHRGRPAEAIGGAAQDLMPCDAIAPCLLVAVAQVERL